MGILSKIKNKLGIGGVKVKLQVPAITSKVERIVEGKITLTSKSEQEIAGVEVRFMEEFTTGRGDSKKTRDFELGMIQISDSYTIKPGEVKEVPFSLSFEFLKSNADSLKEKGGALGALGSVSKFANNEKSDYFVKASVDVKTVLINPSDKKHIKLAD